MIQLEKLHEGQAIKIAFLGDTETCRGRCICRQDFGIFHGATENRITYTIVDPLSGGFDYWLCHLAVCDFDSSIEIDRVELPYEGLYLIDLAGYWDEHSSFDPAVVRQLIRTAAMFFSKHRLLNVPLSEFDCEDIGFWSTDFNSMGLRYVRLYYREWLLASLESSNPFQMPFPPLSSI